MRYAHADVRKSFFLDMFTRDISLEDCILDLIDNSLDAFINREKLRISDLIFDGNLRSDRLINAKIDVSCSERQVKVVDNCGGIDRDRAQNEVFCFGHLPDETPGKLGAYGVGLKRALFKIGKKFSIVSRTPKEGFEVSLNTEEWATKEEWKIPITFIDGSSSVKTAGTSITITDLHEEVKMRMQEGGVPKRVFRDAASTYPFFLEKYADVSINDEPVPANPILIGQSKEITAGREQFEANGVKVTLVASLTPMSSKANTGEQAGWNILCNGRVVVRADKTNLTGWGLDLPTFHSKYTSFVGLALFESDDPLTLPWTTTKRNVNQESAVYIRAKALMVTLTRPILTMLNARYPSEPAEVAEIRDAVHNVKGVDFKELASKPSVGFSFAPPKKKIKRTARVVFDVALTDIEKIRRHLRRPALSPSEIGRFAFDHYVRTECGD
jgi:hypothetical protein